MYGRLAPDEYGWTCAFVPPPSNDSRLWRGERWLNEEPNFEPAIANGYFSISVFGGEGQRRRAKDCFRRLAAVVVDDADPDTLGADPSWVIETSPGNYQIGFIVRSDDCADLARCESVHQALSASGALGGDKSGHNIVRYARLPNATNTKLRDSGPFRHVARVWNPDLRFTLDEVVSALGLKVSPTRTPAENGRGTYDGPGGGFADWMEQVLTGESYHDPLNRLAGHCIANGMHPGATTNWLRAFMEVSRDKVDPERWRERFDDIPRAVCSAEEKFRIRSAQPDPAAMRRVESIWAADATPLLSSDYVIKGILDRGALALVYGASGSAKTFFVADLSLSIASGRPWRGRRVRRGLVVYVAAEAGERFQRRVYAWLARNLTDAGNRASVALLIVPQAVSLLDQAHVSKLIIEIQAHANAKRLPVALIVFDTLARSMAGGDENTVMDIGRAIAAADRIRDELGAATLLVHHQGKDADRGARGSSALPAAVDTSLRICEENGVRFAQVEKARDDVTGARFAFDLELVKLGEDEDGDTVTTCVVVHREDQVSERKEKKRPGWKSAGLALRCLEEALQERGIRQPATSVIPPGTRAVTMAQWRQRYNLRDAVARDHPDVDRLTDARDKRFERARHALLNDGTIEVLGERVWLR